jgi:hypothetical protein
MNWLKSLFGGKRNTMVSKDGNFSDSWVAHPGITLEFDLQAVTLNGVGIGDPPQGLSFLGRAESFGRIGSGEGTEYTLIYPGLWVDLNAQAVRAYKLGFSPDGLDLEDEQDGDEPFQPFRGRLLFGGRMLNWGAYTVESDVVAILGRPVRRDDAMEDTEEPEPYLHLHYDLRGLEWLISFYEGRLTELWVYKRKT